MMKYFRSAVLALLLVCLPALAVGAEAVPDAGESKAAGQYLRGSDLFQKGEYTGAAHWLLKAAEQGYAPAQRDLGLLYKAGAGVPQSDAKALELFKQAAAQNDAEAMYHLGFLYFDAAEPDYAKVAEAWRNAAGLGWEPAAYSLGGFYYHGYIGAPDYDAAIVWYEKAYELGSSAAAYELGLLYMHDPQGVKAYDTGRAWLEKAAERGNTGAKYVLGLLYFNGEMVERNFAKARSYLEATAADETFAYAYPEGMYCLGSLYAQGLGGDTDYVRALECYESAAMQSNVLAQFNLANMYYAGQGLGQKDLHQAYIWFNLAADAGMAEAKEQVAVMERELGFNDLGQVQVTLARAYFFGTGGRPDHVKAYGRLIIARELDQNVAEMLSTLSGLTEAERARGEQMAREWLEAAGVDGSGY